MVQFCLIRRSLEAGTSHFPGDKDNVPTTAITCSLCPVQRRTGSPSDLTSSAVGVELSVLHLPLEKLFPLQKQRGDKEVTNSNTPVS